MNGSTRNNSMKHIYAIIISIIFLISISYLHILLYIFSVTHTHTQTHILCMKLHAHILTDNVIRNKPKGSIKHPVALL